MTQQRKAREDRLEGIHAQLREGVEGLTSSEEWARVLEVASRFHRYSFNNVLLITMQFPEATQVAGYRTWQGLGRQVRKGEKGIRILAPVTKKIEDEETGEVLERRLFFRTVSVFDISQTEGEALPERVRLLEGQGNEEVGAKVVALIEGKGFEVRTETPTIPGANGETDYSAKVVRISPKVSGAQAVKTLVHELGHILLHAPTDQTPRDQREVEAESVAFVVLKALGIDSDDYSFGYVASWAGEEPDLIERTAGAVLKAAREVLEALKVEGSEEVAA